MICEQPHSAGEREWRESEHFGNLRTCSGDKLNSDEAKAIPDGCWGPFEARRGEAGRGNVLVGERPRWTGELTLGVMFRAPNRTYFFMLAGDLATSLMTDLRRFTTDYICC